jgi:hypothetical protein
MAIMIDIEIRLCSKSRSVEKEKRERELYEEIFGDRIRARCYLTRYARRYYSSLGFGGRFDSNVHLE